MTEPTSESLTSMRAAFPGYYPPTAQEKALWLREGTVALDANVLLDAYRYSPASRRDLIRVLKLLQARLFVPHQAALEFHRNRISALAEHVEWFPKQTEALAVAQKKSTDVLRSVVKQCQAAASDGLKNAIQKLEEAFAEAKRSIDQVASEYDLDVGQALTADHILAELDVLLNAAVGPPLSEEARKRALADFKLRVEKKIPPGYKDVGKSDAEDAAGDYFIWLQLLDRARAEGQPMVFITHDLKEDWTRREKSVRAGTQPLLIEEMWRHAKVPFVCMTPSDLVRELAGQLDAEIGADTLQEMSELERRVFDRLSFSDPVSSAGGESWLRREHPELLLKLGRGGTVTQAQMRELLGPLWDEASGYRAAGGTWPVAVRQLFLRRAAIAEEAGELSEVLAKAGAVPEFAERLRISGALDRLRDRLDALRTEDADLADKAQNFANRAGRSPDLGWSTQPSHVFPQEGTDGPHLP